MTFTAEDIAKVLRVHQRSVRRRAARESWPFTTETVRGGRRCLYDLKDLPEDIEEKIFKHPRHSLDVTAAQLYKRWSFKMFIKNLIALGRQR